MADMGFLSLRLSLKAMAVWAPDILPCPWSSKLPACLPAPRRCLPCLLPLDAIHLFGTEAQKQKYLVPGIQALTVAPGLYRAGYRLRPPSSSPQLPKGNGKYLISGTSAYLQRRLQGAYRRRGP